MRKKKTLKCNHKLDHMKTEKDAIMQSNHYGNDTFSQDTIHLLGLLLLLAYKVGRKSLYATKHRALPEAIHSSGRCLLVPSFNQTLFWVPPISRKFSRHVPKAGCDQ